MRQRSGFLDTPLPPSQLQRSHFLIVSLISILPGNGSGMEVLVGFPVTAVVFPSPDKSPSLAQAESLLPPSVPGV